MKKNIAIVAGGDQSEVVVSKKSAAGLLTFIDTEKYNLYLVILEGNNWTAEVDGKTYSIDKNDFSFTKDGQKVTFDCAYVTIHGIPGEDGRLQGYFEMIGMPYTCCNVLAAAMTYNKYTCNHYLSGFGVNIAPDILLRKGQTVSADEAVAKLGLPMFIKPNVGGSSFGVTKVKKAEEVEPAIAKAFAEGDEVILESFMKGTEITCGVYKTDEKTVVFPITEVVSENEFFDYDAKYKGQVSEITPARLSDELTKRVQAETAKIYDIIGAKGIIRVDYIITEGDKINILEVNTTPGMTPTSFIPQQVRAAGLDIKDVMTDVIEFAMKK
ncbi:MAG: D-alanine--D-alanine ligase [Paludibacteraceae bacterium]|nr:D-alanine--D-alanine ligase [Paludibacteraceae bacterium]MBR2623521.1 D-alanine--D-alanine ligase [Paludibacteraceae bacterium]